MVQNKVIGEVIWHRVRREEDRTLGRPAGEGNGNVPKET